MKIIDFKTYTSIGGGLILGSTYAFEADSELHHKNKKPKTSKKNRTQKLETYNRRANFKEDALRK